MRHSPVLLVVPPLTQVNTPYPATAYLSGFLRSHGYGVGEEAGPLGTVFQADVGLEMVLALFSRAGLTRVFADVRRLSRLPGEAKQMLALERAYVDSIEPVVAFLQNREPALAPLIGQGRFLPRGPRFERSVRVGATSDTDLAKHLATLYLEDLADLIQRTIAPQFALSRYAEQVGVSAGSFDSIEQALAQPLSVTDDLMVVALERHLTAVQPAVVGLTVPFPGNLYGALRIAQAVKTETPEVTVVLGGGYANTELRRLRDPRVFEWIDYITLDDGERPLLCLLEHLAGKRERTELCRTYSRANGRVIFSNGAQEADFRMAEIGTPTYRGLPLDRYLSIIDTLNPMHRLWSDGHWNKLTVAHGCYWKQCTFCDVGLDYIGRYEAAPDELLADRIEALIAETRRRAFHFVDEAAPPAALKALALRLLERGVVITWWGNVRFEEAFTADLCRLLAASGCIAVSAGLEVAADRLLEKMKKGITVDQTARVAAAFRSADILIHAYLMFGFPGETIGETIDSLERVRQLFAQDLIQSGFWHRFVATAHSPIGLNPDRHGIRLTGPTFGGFAENDLTHDDPGGPVPAWLGAGLRAALVSYMEGEGIAADVRTWFPVSVPRPKVPREWVVRALPPRTLHDAPHTERRCVWIGGAPVLEGHGPIRRLILPGRTSDLELRLSAEQAHWVVQLIEAAMPSREKRGHGYPSLRELGECYPFGGCQAFTALLRSRRWKRLRAGGLLVV